MRVDDLVAPRGDDELWDLDEEALRLRPYMTGDVFADVDDGDGDPIAVMIVGHPCVIRGSRGQLSRRVPCCVVKQMQEAMSYDQWPEAASTASPCPRPSASASAAPPTCSSGAACDSANSGVSVGGAP